MTTKKKNLCKTFRLFDFHTYDNSTEKEELKWVQVGSSYDNDEKCIVKKKTVKNFCIQMFGINEKGESCSIIVNDYKPFFYVKVSNDFNDSDMRSFDNILKTVDVEIEIVKHKKLYGFSAGKKFKFVKFTFQSNGDFSKIKSSLTKKIRYENFNIKKEKVELYESNIPPLLRYFHINSISPSGWIQINTTKATTCKEKTTTCTFEYEASLKHIKPLPNMEKLVPYKICSFDIEASSSHGDFPVPIKSYKRLASNIVDLFNTYNPTGIKSNQLLKNSILSAFGYSNFDGIDIVYPKDEISKEELLQLFNRFINRTIRDAQRTEAVKDILTISKLFDKQEDDDDDEYYNKPSKKINDKTLIIDILENESYNREEKVNFLDTLLTSIFPMLEGDKVTFIGSTFMNYGECEPYLNHCLVLGSCDKIDNITVDTCKTEEELLIKWTDLIQSENPDIIIGYNIFGFDYEFMFRRAQENKCEPSFLSLSKRSGEMCGKFDQETNRIEIENTKVLLASGEYDLKYYKMPGRLQIDMYTYFRRDFNLSSYKLDDVAGEFISDDIIKTDLIKVKNKKVTHLYSKNLVGLNVGDFIHIEICSFTTDYFQNGKKFKVINIENVQENEDTFNVISIEGHYELQGKLKWTMAKDDVTPQDIFRLTNGSSSDRAIVAKYCVQDCNLVHHLMRKIDVVTGYVEMSSICSVPISFLVFRGQGIKLTSYVAKKCREKDTLMPDLEKGGSNEGYEGAIVLPPKCSMYMDNPVACVDYSSLYPSSMISQNYSHDSKVWTKEYNLKDELIKQTGETDKNGNFIYDNLPEYQYIDIEFDTFKYERKTPTSKAEKIKSGRMVCRWAQLPNNEKSIMPAILEELLKARKATKKLMKNEKDPFMENILDKRQLGYKVTANSLYGQCGAKTSTFYEKDVAASTTATGRMMIIYAKRMIEEVYGNLVYETKESGKVRTRAEYIYGDTDSVFFTFNLEDPETGEKIKGKQALALTIEIAQDVADLCTSFLKPPMGLEYEKTLMPFILLSKKRYVGMLYETNPNKGKMKFMGLSLKRRDSCDYLKDTYGEILNILMYENNIEKAIEYLNECLQNLIQGKVSMDKLSITRALRSDYKNPNQIAHKVLANRIGERDPGNKPKPGDRIKYVFIVNDKPKALLGEKIETPEFIIEHKLKIDYTYYITNQLMKPLQQLFGLALVQIWQNKRKTGAIREYEKNISKLEKENEDYEIFNKKKEKFCSQHVKTILFDKILTEVANDKNKNIMITSFFK